MYRRAMMLPNPSTWYPSLLLFPFIDLKQSQFAGLLSMSILYDIVWMINNEQGVFLRLLTLILFLLKVSKLNIITVG